ncbi:hypothetical protein M2D63_025590, partial [Pseudomonas sp. BJa5]|uniref:hypothetical protein n=1 Tax=Pseudomonas sp. BJa5 TaxID=2936270 RepID=UPI002559CDF5
HKHPHELLDSIVKERLAKRFASAEARILRFPHLLSSVLFEVFRSNSTAWLAAISRQREANSTAFKLAVNHLFHHCRPCDRSHPVLPETFNSLILKEFSVSTAPEVGR